MEQIRVSDMLFCEKDFKFKHGKNTFEFDRVLVNEGVVIITSTFYTSNTNCTFNGSAMVFVDPEEYEKHITKAIESIFMNKPDMVIKRGGEVCVVYGCYGDDDESEVIEIPVNLDLRPWEDNYRVELN